MPNLIRHFNEHPEFGVRLPKHRLRSFLHERLNLKYGRYVPQRIGSTADALAERRYYVAWLLTHMIKEDWVVIAVDESAI